METGRAIFNSLLKGKPVSRPPFIPLLGDLAARVGGLSTEAWNSDPTLWANSLVQASDILGSDGIVVGFDFTLLAEACGCRVAWEDDRPSLAALSGPLRPDPEERGRLKNALEAAGRVFQVCRKERVCAAALAGPVTLAGQLFGPEETGRAGELKEPVVRATEAFCRTAPDFLIFMENRLPPFSELGPSLRRVYATLQKITAYYNVAAGLYLQDYGLEAVEQYAALQMDLWIPGPALSGRKPSMEQIYALGAESLAVGTGLPLDDPEQASAMIGEGIDFYRAAGRQPGLFFTSLGPVTRHADLETLRGLTRQISRTSL